MTKGKSKKAVDIPDLPVTVGKPAFEQALAFAEEGLARGVSTEASPRLQAQYKTSLTGGLTQASSLMPTDERSRRILRERAQALAVVGVAQGEESSEQFLRFRLGAVENYGIPYTCLQELLHVGNLARVPCTPASIAGVVNHRGELLTVIDLKHFFRIDPVPQDTESRIVVVQQGAIRAGILVDEVEGNEKYRQTDLAPPLSSNGVANMEHVLGIHKGSVTMLNIEALLNDPALMVGQSD